MHNHRLLNRKNGARTSFRTSVRPMGNAVEIAPSASEVAIDFAELENGTRIEIIENPDDATNCLFAVCTDGNVRYERRVASGGRVFIPVARRSGILANVPLPKGVLPCETPLDLIAQMVKLLAACLDLPPLDIILLAFFALSTWFPEKLPVAPYLALVGLPRSGKTTALRVLSMLCRRPLLVTDVTAAALYRAYDGGTPTVLIDETRTASDERALFHLLRSGSTPGFLALRGSRTYNCFGPKVITWTELPNDDALNSRCIFISLQETDRTNLRNPSDPRIVEQAEIVQMKLLRFRLEKFNTVSVSKILKADRLHSRGRDIYEALALAICEDKKLCAALASMIEGQEKMSRGPMSLVDSVVLHALFPVAHDSSKPYWIPVVYLTSAANARIRARRENVKLTPHAVGRALTALGFTNRKRFNNGWNLAMDEAARKRIHTLIRCYGVDESGDLSQLKQYPGCDFCESLHAPFTAPTDARPVRRKRRRGDNNLKKR
jgi:hypothetical protein